MLRKGSAIMIRKLYSCNQTDTKNDLFFKQLKNSWNIDKVDVENYLKDNKIEFKQYSEKHFETIYKLVYEKISKMDSREKILYIEYRKSHFDVLNENNSVKFMISFLFGGSITGIYNYFTTDKVSNILILLAFILFVAIYFFMLISQKKSFNKRLVAALEKTTSKE